jgi:hypothetical protein
MHHCLRVLVGFAVGWLAAGAVAGAIVGYVAYRLRARDDNPLAGSTWA